MGSNEFVDASLMLTADHFDNIVSIIRSARTQGHDGVEIRLFPAALSAIQTRVAELAAIENVDIDACFYGEHQGKEKLIAVFREHAGTWLLQRAEAALTKVEFEELRRLVFERLSRSPREVELTLKALGGERK